MSQPAEYPLLVMMTLIPATRADRKTVTRRVARLTDCGHVRRGRRRWHPADPEAFQASPYGVRGDRLWVRETWLPDPPIDGSWSGDIEWHGCGRSIAGVPEQFRSPAHCIYAADGLELVGWKPSIHMPRWASRILLEVTDVRLERLQMITTKDIFAEGLTVPSGLDAAERAIHAHEAFRTIWDAKNARRGHGWASNPWVWRVAFRRLHG